MRLSCGRVRIVTLCIIHCAAAGSTTLVVTFHSREKEEWGVREGSKEEVLSYFEGIHPLPHQMLDRPTSWKRWATADRDPVERWSDGRATVLRDAAHPMTQYLAQGACQALEDADVLADEARRQASGSAGSTRGPFDWDAVLAGYAQRRVSRTAQVQRNARAWGDFWHVDGDERVRRNARLRDRKTHDYTHVDWLYGHRAAE